MQTPTLIDLNQIKDILRSAGFTVHPNVIREQNMLRLNGVCEQCTVEEIEFSSLDELYIGLKKKKPNVALKELLCKQKNERSNYTLRGCFY